MTLVRWDPFNRTMATLQGRINQMFEDSLGRSRDVEDELATCNWKPPVDIYEIADAFVLKAEVPGVARENVHVELKDNILTIKGERPAEAGVEEEQYYRKERCFGTFQRSFSLREMIKPESIKARFKEGVLEIEIPKAEREKPKQIKVEVE